MEFGESFEHCAKREGFLMNMEEVVEEEVEEEKVEEHDDKESEQG